MKNQHEICQGVAFLADMGVNVRECKPCEWWVFLHHKGRGKAKKVGSREAAEATASGIDEKPGTEAFHLRS